MKATSLISIIILLCLHGSCKQEPPEVPPPFGVTFIGQPSDSLPDGQNLLSNSTWIIYQYRIGGIGGQQDLSDTLVFSGNRDLLYNGYLTRYSCTYSLSGVNLTFYESPWGAISGLIYPYNIQQGSILGAAFNNMMSPNEQPVYLWIRKVK
jgi:hypothetical protein